MNVRNKLLPETIQKLFCDRDEWLQLQGVQQILRYKEFGLRK